MSVRKMLVLIVIKYFGECLIVLRTDGCANITAFRKHISERLKLIETNDDDDVSDHAQKIALYVKTLFPEYTDTYHFKDFALEKTPHMKEEKIVMQVFLHSYRNV